MSTFERALDFVLEHEGGYVNDPQDPGGETIYGISRRAHPEAWANGRPTREHAAEIYLKDYWKPLRCDQMTPAVALMLFDTGVNTGVARATLMLQTAVKTTVDGKIGPITIKAAHNRGDVNVAADLATQRMLFYAGLKTWPRYRKGWTRRVMMAMAEGARL